MIRESVADHLSLAGQEVLWLVISLALLVLSFQTQLELTRREIVSAIYSNHSPRSMMVSVVCP